MSLNDIILKKKCAHNRVSALVKRMYFSAFWKCAEKYSLTLQNSGVLTNRSTQTYEVSMERSYSYLLLGTHFFETVA